MVTEAIFFINCITFCSTFLLNAVQSNTSVIRSIDRFFNLRSQSSYHGHHVCLELHSIPSVTFMWLQGYVTDYMACSSDKEKLSLNCTKYVFLLALQACILYLLLFISEFGDEICHSCHHLHLRKECIKYFIFTNFMMKNEDAYYVMKYGFCMHTRTCAHYIYTYTPLQ